MTTYLKQLITYNYQVFMLVFIKDLYTLYDNICMRIWMLVHRKEVKDWHLKKLIQSLSHPDAEMQMLRQISIFTLARWFTIKLGYSEDIASNMGRAFIVHYRAFYVDREQLRWIDTVEHIQSAQDFAKAYSQLIDRTPRTLKALLDPQYHQLFETGSVVDLYKVLSREID